MVANIIPGWLGIKLEKKLNGSVQMIFIKLVWSTSIRQNRWFK